MARFTMEQAENYSSAKSNYFNLKDDGETARIRFLINDINDLLGVSVHKVKVGDREVDVECIREYNEPVDNCPLCAADYKINARLYIPVYDEDAKVTKIWARGSKFFNTIAGLCARYNPLVSTIFEVERHGKKGDPQTEYQFFVVKTDDKKLQDFESVDAENTAFLTKTAEELDEFLRTGNFSNNTKKETKQSSRNERQVPVRRRPAMSEEDNF